MSISKILRSSILFFMMVAAPMLAEGDPLPFLELTTPAEATIAPDITLNDLNGNPASLSGYRGKVVLLHFWASWCLPCRKEFPKIQGLWQRLKEKDFVVLAIAEDSHKAVKEFIRKEDIGLPILVDQYGSALRSYGIKALPASYIVNKEGRMEAIAVGPREWDSDGAYGLISSMLNK